MRRREFMTLLGGAAVARPRAVRAQQASRMRLIGFLEPISADTPGAKAREMAFAKGLQELGWTPGRDVQIESRWSLRR